ncbi:alpha-L-fucosidase [Enterococcus sp. AZ194]
MLRTVEIIDRYQPKVLYFDWWIQHEAFKESLQLLAAYYYNSGETWGQEVAICYKHDAMMFGSGVVEIERGKFSEAQPFYWQSDTAIARNSWCYTETLDYKEVKEILYDLIEVVSKNGNLLLNVGPKGDGSIAEKDQQILKEIGRWLKTNGEAIYASKPWRKAGEGPTRLISGQFQENTPTTYTKEDIRFAVAGDAIYAFLLAPNEGEPLTIKSLAASSNQDVPEFHGLIKEVHLLGGKEELDWQVTNQGLTLTLPEHLDDLPKVCKIIIV